MSNASSTRGLSSKGTALTDNAPLRCQAPRSPRPPRRPVRVSLPRRRGLDPRVGDHHAWPNSSPRGVFEQLGRREMLQGTSAPSRAGRGTAVDASCIVLLAARPTRRRGLREKVRDAPREIDVEGGSQHRRGARAGGSEDAAARPRRDLTKRRRARFRPKLRRDELGFSSAPAPARPRVARPRVSAAVSKKKFRERCRYQKLVDVEQRVSERKARQRVPGPGDDRGHVLVRRLAGQAMLDLRDERVPRVAHV